MKNRINCIDGWRAVAAMGVLFTHTLGILSHPSWLVGPVDLFVLLNIWGNGVHLFFVISGFCFLLILSERKDFSLKGIFGFWKKRWLRIAPAFYVACLVYGLYRYGHLSKELITSLFANFIFLQTYIPNTEIAALFWSLSVEWLFYLMLPFLFIMMNNLGYFSMIAAIIITGILLNLLHNTGYIYPGNTAWYYTIFANVEHFGWGILVGYIFKKKLLVKSFLSGIGGFFLGLIITGTGKVFFYSVFVKQMGRWGFIFESTGPLIMTLGFSLMILSSLRNKLLTSIMSNRMMVFIGRISYSFYLWHILVLELCFKFLKQFVKASAGGVGILACTTLIVLVPVSYISYKLLESFYFKLSFKDPAYKPLG